jgi:hypothetical protein
MRQAATVTMLVALVAAAGCGSDDDAAPASAADGAPLTKAQFIASADKICKETTVKLTSAAANLREATKKTGTVPVRRVAAFLTKTSLPAYDAMLEDIRALTPPKRDEQTIDGLVAALAGAIDTARSDPLKYSDPRTPDPFLDANKRAVGYGMKVCGS